MTWNPSIASSTPDQALEICAEAGIRRLVLYHHAPTHGDDQMDRISAEYHARGARQHIDVVTSYEGMTLSIGPEAT